MNAIPNIPPSDALLLSMAVLSMAMMGWAAVPSLVDSDQLLGAVAANPAWFHEVIPDLLGLTIWTLAGYFTVSGCASAVLLEPMVRETPYSPRFKEKKGKLNQLFKVGEGDGDSRLSRAGILIGLGFDNARANVIKSRKLVLKAKRRGESRKRIRTIRWRGKLVAWFCLTTAIAAAARSLFMRT